MSVPSGHKRVGGPRGEVTGWSSGAARRNVAFLRSVDENQLEGFGLALTLTLKECPESADAWHKLRRAWWMRQVRAGLICGHWVTEFQARGVPHLHAAMWYDWDDDSGVRRMYDPTWDWVDVVTSAGLTASEKGQHVRIIDGVVGWFQYVAKHVTRSKRHYQRQRASLPAEWKKTGRIWGKTGDWPVVEPVKIRVGFPQWYQYRRLLQRWRLAEAKRGLPLNRRQVSHLRRLRKCNKRELSRVRGLSEWVPELVQHELIAAAGGEVGEIIDQDGKPG